eukprot:s557_g17.t1
MRSLYMQARMAHQQHSEFPDPDKELDVFKSECPNRMDYVRRCLGIASQSVADAIVEEPVEWDAGPAATGPDLRCLEDALDEGIANHFLTICSKSMKILNNSTQDCETSSHVPLVSASAYNPRRKADFQPVHRHGLLA